MTRSPAPSFREVILDGWTASISEEVIQKISAARLDAGPLETGGMLVGAWTEYESGLASSGTIPRRRTVCQA